MNTNAPIVASATNAANTAVRSNAAHREPIGHALMDGAKIVGRAVAHGVIAALALSALTFAIAQRAHAAPAAVAIRLAPVNAELPDLYVAAGGTFHRAGLVKSHTEVWVNGNHAEYKSVRVFDVVHNGSATLVAPLAPNASVHRVEVDAPTQLFSATGARNDAGYDETMLVDSRGATRLTYDIGALTPGAVVVEMSWTAPVDDEALLLRVPIRNSRERVVLASSDPDLADHGCGGAPEPMTWSVRVTPDWQVDATALAGEVDREEGAESSWVWAAGSLEDAPTHVALNLQRKAKPAQKPVATIVANITR
jgi:hypothetical protein